MREQQIQGYINGIRDEFILEAEPKALAALLPETDPVAGTVILSSPAEGSRRKTRGKAKRWIPLIVAAAVTLTVGLNLGLYAGMNALLGQGGALLPSTPSGGNPLGGLFPFLQPEETDTTEDTSACADGHAWDTESIARVCYIRGYTQTICQRCGKTDTIYVDPLPHSYENGVCSVCGLIEGSAENCRFKLDSELQAQTGELGVTLVRVEDTVEGELIIPNVGYVKDYGMLPVTSVGSGILLSGSEANPTITRVVFPDTVCRINDKSFRNVSTLTEVVWPASLEIIGSQAFQGTNLTVLDFPEGLHTLEESAFEDCFALTTLTLPASVKQMGQTVFSDCKSLTSITFKCYDFSMAFGVFMGCSALESIVLPEGMKTIGDNAFSACISLTSVTLPSTLESTGRYAFSDCSSLTSVSLPDGITIEDGAFQGCTAMTSLTLPPNTGSIGSYAFGNTGLTELIVEGSIHSIDSGAFSNTQLTSVVIPGSLQGINDAFNGTPLKELVVLGTANHGIVGLGAFENHPTLERVVLPKGMARIQGSAFKGCTNLAEIQLPDGLERIEEGAFQGCTSLTQIHIPDSVTLLERDVFFKCSSLVSVHLPSGLEELPNQIFSHCSSLTTVEFPENLTIIGTLAFYGTAISSMHVPKTVKSIGSYALADNTVLTEVIFEGTDTDLDSYLFYGCTALEKVVLPDRLRELPPWLFRNCTSLRDVTLPSALVELEDQLFENCTSLQELVIPDGVKEVRFFARDCTSLERIVLPASMNKISEYAFKECPNLRELIMSEKNTAYKVVDGCLIHVSTKTLIAGTCNAVIPTDGSVTAIAENAFYSRNITSMVIPEGITSIGENCFRNCKLLEEVRIREGVVKIDQYAFYDCKNLQRIYLSSTVSFLGNKIFQNCTALTEVYLEGNVKKWQTMTQGLDQTDVKYTVYCKNGMIEPDGTVTLYDDPET